MKSLLVLLPLIFLSSCSIFTPERVARQQERIKWHVMHLELKMKEKSCYYCDVLYRDEFWKDVGVKR